MAYIKNNNTLKQNKNKKYKCKNKLKKLTQKQHQKGGSSSKKENFEVQSFNNFDFNKISVAKYINSNVDWGTCPGIPPKPDCTIL
jgi:hypothetical protein